MLCNTCLKKLSFDFKNASFLRFSPDADTQVLVRQTFILTIFIPTGGTVYMGEGNNVKALPNTVEITEGVLMAGEKKTGYSRTGVAGVVCYRMQDVSKSFCLMYKVPWSGDNYWNIKIYDGNKAASSSVYNELQSGALKGGSSVAKKDLGTGEYTVTNDDGSKQKTPYTIFMKDASMTNSDGATLQVSLGVKITGEKYLTPGIFEKALLQMTQQKNRLSVQG